MKIIHNQYRSYPPPNWVRELWLEDHLGEVSRRVIHGLGRLGPWEHLEIKGFKIDGFESRELMDSIRTAIKKHGWQSSHYVIRAEINAIRIWKIPVQCKNWKEVVNTAMEAGAIYDHGHVEYMPIKSAKGKVKAPTYLDIMEKEKKEEKNGPKG